MPLVVKDRVKETTTTTGTGTITLAGAVTGFQAFSVIGDGNTTYYTITLSGTAEFEVGIGTYTLSGTTLSRDTILESSNSGSAVNFSAGTKDVFVTYPAERAVYTDAAGTAITPATASTLGVASGGTGAAALTANNVILGNGTSAVNFVAPGSNGNVLTSNGTTWVSAAASGGFDAGTRMLFAQTTAPTGWTKDTTNYNNHALRVVTGTASTGGTVDFVTAFASQTPTGTVTVTGSTGQIAQGGTVSVSASTGLVAQGGTVSVSASTGLVAQGGTVSVSTGQAAGSVSVGPTTLSTPTIPAHSHTFQGIIQKGTGADVATGLGWAGASPQPTQALTGSSPANPSPTFNSTANTGGGGSHTHPGSGGQHAHPASGSFSGQQHSHPVSAPASFTGSQHSHPVSAPASFTGSLHDHPVSAPASFSGSAINLAVKYLDVITATKD